MNIISQSMAIPATNSRNCAAVFGNGICSVTQDTFHVSCLNAVNTPCAYSALPGSVMYKLRCNLLDLDKVLVIQ
jgi:hypothetical protein